MNGTRVLALDHVPDVQLHVLYSRKFCGEIFTNQPKKNGLFHLAVEAALHVYACMLVNFSGFTFTSCADSSNFLPPLHKNFPLYSMSSHEVSMRDCYYDYGFMSHGNS